MLDLIVRNVTVVDGSGEKSYLGDVGIKDGVFVMRLKFLYKAGMS